MRFAAATRSYGLTCWRAIERCFDAVFGSGLNPLRHLGALGFLALWLLVLSGTVLYVILDTSVEGSYRSIDALADHLPGRLLRGMHRYAADTLVVVMVLHLVREWLFRHESGFRRYSWLTGVALVAFVMTAAIGGFWLHWDELGQYSAIATAEWLDALPLLGVPLARNFLVPDAVDDRLISLFVFVHLGVSLFLLFGLWFHIQRITRASVWPPRPLAVGLTATLLLLSALWPVVSHGPASLSSVPERLQLDWILLWIHPLTDATSPALGWVLVGGLLLVLLGLPFVGRRVAAPVAVVDPDNCNGCSRCFEDCPYAAITMVPHPNQRIGRSLAVVDPDLCASCGICAGACPSSTPFRSVADLVSGIDLPGRPVSDLRRRLQALMAGSMAERPLVVFACDHGVRTAHAAGDDVHPLGLVCAGQLPPSFVEYALRDGAAGVLVAACREGGCEFRCGERWIAERLDGRREPQLRSSVDRNRLHLVFAGPGDEALLRAELDRLRERVRALPPQFDTPRRLHNV